MNPSENNQKKLRKMDLSTKISKLPKIKKSLFLLFLVISKFWERDTFFLNGFRIVSDGFV